MSYVFTDHNYHLKQKDPKASVREEIRSIYKSVSGEIEKKTENLVNSLGDVKDFYYKIRDNKAYYSKNIDRFTNNITIDTDAINRDPVLSGMQKCFMDQMLKNAIDKNGSGFIKNSYSGYGSSAHFMIRALSYIYPVLIVKPLAKFTWREDWPILEGNAWAAFDVFLTAQRVYNATDENEQSSSSGRTQAQFGESIFQNITLRQDLVWDSTVEMYADQSMNNGLVNYMFMESLKRGFDQKVNDIYLFGDSGYGITGLTSNSNIANVSTSGSWNAINSSTGEKYSTVDLINLCSAVEQNSNGVYTAKKIMMSLKLKPYVIQPRSAYVSTSPIGYVAGQKWGEDFETALSGARYNPYLNDQGTNATTQIAFAYDPDVENAHIGVPVFMFAEPLTYESHKFKIPFLTRTGGFRVIQSPSIVKMDNISTS